MQCLCHGLNALLAISARSVVWLLELPVVALRFAVKRWLL
jgi:hypothetical protein